MVEISAMQTFLIYFMKTLGICLGIFSISCLSILFLIFLNFWSERRKWRK